jgi:hypothetical protein
VPLQPRPVLELIGLGLLGGQRDDQVRGLAAGFPVDGAGSGDPYGLFGVGEAEPARGEIGQRIDGAGLLAAVSFVAALVTDRDFGPGQRFEQTVQRRLVRLDCDHVWTPREATSRACPVWACNASYGDVGVMPTSLFEGLVGGGCLGSEVGIVLGRAGPRVIA